MENVDNVEKKAEAEKKTTKEQRTWTGRSEKNENGTVADKNEKKETTVWTAKW